MKKKLIALVLSAIMAAGILGGCGKSGGGVQEVDFWSAPNQGQYDYWVEKAEAFNATKTEVNGKVIEVKVQQMPESPSSEAGIQTAISTSTVPAVRSALKKRPVMVVRWPITSTIFRMKTGLKRYWQTEPWRRLWRAGKLTESST